MARTGLPLGVRNRLAELILEAFDDASARETLGALAAFCRGEDPGAASARLAGLGWFEPAGSGPLRLLGAHQPYRPALCQRVAAAAAMLAGVPAAPSEPSLAALLDRAARLADAGLFFEVHELLEPRWMRAEGEARLGLQGLIQVAVALHHAEHGNRAGAVSLLGEGLAKLEAGAGALPLPLATWLPRLRDLLAAWRTGAPPPPPPPWPSPPARGSEALRGASARPDG